MVRLMKRWTRPLAFSLVGILALLLMAGCATGLEEGAQTVQLSTPSTATPARPLPTPSGSDATRPAPIAAAASAPGPSASPTAPADAQERTLPATTPTYPAAGATATPAAGASRAPLPGRPPTGAGRLPCLPPKNGERIPLGEARSRQEIVDKARRDLAARLDLPLAAIQVVRVTETWPAEPPGPPGPPRMVPDRAYPDEPYPGGLPTYHIVLSAEGVQYHYEACGTWLIFLDPESLGCGSGEA
jgi:hypothetical protein